MKIVTAAEMRAIDLATTKEHGVPSLTLMENAGIAVAEFAALHFDFSSVCIVCGKGNNGGDGFVAARHLREAGKKISLLVLARESGELRGDAAEMFRKLDQGPDLTILWISDEGDFSNAEVRASFRCDLILDAIVGTGFTSPLRGLPAKAVEVINEAEAPVVAVDLPSGAYTDSALPAERQGTMARSDAIITFTAPKMAHAAAGLTAGPIAVAEIGSPPVLGFPFSAPSNVSECNVMSGREVVSPALIGRRKLTAHKGNFGHVLVIGGSVGKAGAAAMAGIAALRTGAGLVTVACPESVQPTVAAFAAELMTEPLAQTAEGSIALSAIPRVEHLLEGKTSVVIGPGLGRNPETAEFVRKCAGLCTQANLLLDADGIGAFAGHMDSLAALNEIASMATVVLTPHPGEMARLIGSTVADVEAERLKTAQSVSDRTGACVVLKGHRTVITTGKGYSWINLTGNPGMAKGGSGDVLSGMIAALLSQSGGMFGYKVPGPPGGSGTTGDPELDEINRLSGEMRGLTEQKDQEATMLKIMKLTRRFTSALNAFRVAAAVYLHGLGGDIAFDLRGEHSMVATDIINSIGEAISVCEEEAKGRFAYLRR